MMMESTYTINTLNPLSGKQFISVISDIENSKKLFSDKKFCLSFCNRLIKCNRYLVDIDFKEIKRVEKGEEEDHLSLGKYPKFVEFKNEFYFYFNYLKQQTNNFDKDHINNLYELHTNGMINIKKMSELIKYIINDKRYDYVKFTELRKSSAHIYYCPLCLEKNTSYGDLGSGCKICDVKSDEADWINACDYDDND